MSVRDRLIELIQNGGGPHYYTFSIKEAVEIELDTFAHGLADAIRDHIGRTDYPGESQHAKNIVAFGRSMADLIDPEVE